MILYGFASKFAVSEEELWQNILVAKKVRGIESQNRLFNLPK